MPKKDVGSASTTITPEEQTKRMKAIVGSTAHWVILMGEFAEANQEEFFKFVKSKHEQYEAVSKGKG